MKIKEDTHEYRLTGRFWGVVMGAILSGTVSIAVHFYPATTWYAVSGLFWRAGTALAQRNEFIEYACGAAAVLMAVSSLASFWITRTLLITQGNLIVFEPKLSKRKPHVIPLLEIGNVTRVIKTIPLRYDNAFTRSLRDTVRFSYGEFSFGVCNAQFRSKLEFEDFCARIGAPKSANIA